MWKVISDERLTFTGNCVNVQLVKRIPAQFSKMAAAVVLLVGHFLKEPNLPPRKVTALELRICIKCCSNAPPTNEILAEFSIVIAEVLWFRRL